jgi:SAM-dependent methyltransferase
VLLPDDGAFTPEELASGSGTYFERRARESASKARWRRRLPAFGANRRGSQFRQTVERAVADLVSGQPDAQGIVVGCGQRGSDRVADFIGLDWIFTDVDLHYGADAAADIRQLPLADATVDVVLVEHVLEHVLDPIQAAAEIERVLRPGGLVVATIPFCFPWHGVPVDFFRVTPSGMLALFRGCEVRYLEAGMGNGSALGYGAATTLLANQRRGRLARRAAYVIVRILVSPLKRLDRLGGPGGQVVSFAAEYQFLGRRCGHRRSDREVLLDIRARFP